MSRSACERRSRILSPTRTDKSPNHSVFSATPLCKARSDPSRPLIEPMEVPSAVVEAAALGELGPVKSWAGPVDARAKHPSLPAGTTLLMAAASAGADDVVRWLLDHGANPSLHAAGGITALVFATSGGHVSTVEMLLADGASLEAVTLEKKDHVRLDGRRTASSSYTALQIAEANKDTAILAVLRAHTEKLKNEAAAAAEALLFEEDTAQDQVAALLSEGTIRAARGGRKRTKKRGGRAQPSSQAQTLKAQPSQAPESSHEPNRVLPEASRAGAAGAAGAAATSGGSLVADEPSEGVEHSDDEAPVTEELALSYPFVRSATALPAAADAARRRGAHLGRHGAPPPPPPPPTTPQCARRRRVPASVQQSTDAYSAVEPLLSPAAVGPLLSPALTSPSARSALESSPPGSSTAHAAALELEEYSAMEARAEAKAQHMRELDERFEMLQLARATSHSSLAHLDSSTSLASMASGATEEPPDELTCVICMENPTDATLVHGSSAHVCCCLGCAQNLKRLDQSCPMCRKPIEAVLRLYFA
jgi:hypothetical protein